MVWPMVIAAGASLLGSAMSSGLLGGNKDQYHPEVWRNDAYKNYLKQIQGVKDAANKHGFHPLALLGSQMQAPGVYAVPGQAPSGDPIGSALQAFGSTVGDLYMSDQDRKERAEIRKDQQRQWAIDNLRSKEITPEMRLQRENMQLQNELLRADIATSRTKLANARSAAIGGAPTVQSMTGPFDSKFSPQPGRITAGDAEDVYGEPGDWLFGAGGLLEDFVEGRVKVGPKVQNPLTRNSPGVWLDLPSLIRKLRSAGPGSVNTRFSRAPQP